MTNDSEKEQLWKIYELLPEELQKAIFSSETADAVWNVCEKYDINEVNKLAKATGEVLLGLIPPEQFQEAIKNSLKLDLETSKRVATEIDRFVFYPVRPLLDKLYHSETTTTISSASSEAKTEAEKTIELKKTLRKDSYRESVEEKTEE